MHGRERRADESDGSAHRRRAMQQIAVVGNKAYLNGGRVSEYIDGETQNSNGATSSELASTFSLPLDKLWSNSTKNSPYGDYSPNADSRRPRPIRLKQALWGDRAGKMMYRWGGATSWGKTMDEDDVVLFRFDPDRQSGDQWDEADKTPEDVDGNTFVGNSNGASASCNGLGFYVGGLASNASDSTVSANFSTPGVLMYDMEDGTWTNSTTVPLNEPNGHVWSMEAQCTTAFNNADPLLVVLGGKSDSGFMSMNSVWFWDPAEKEWYNQTATGDVPSEREYFCTAGAESKGGTYEIFVYGGRDADGETLDDIHVLSLPAFHWFNTNVSAPARLHHACASGGNGQMLAVGGVEKEWEWETPDPWRWSVGVLDMKELEWKDGYNGDAGEYEAADAVRQWYSDGNLDNVQWDDETAKSLFDKSISVDVPKETPSTSSGDGSSEASGDGGSSSNTGAIVGGVIGGIAALAVLGALLWFLRRRKKKGTQAAELVGDHAHGALPPKSMSSSPASGTRTDSNSEPVSEMATVGHERLELPEETSGRAELPTDFNLGVDRHFTLQKP
ncbi:uncharacterized protein F5Z01DRAFT_662528 [Emericellopsis atlantica]|uniref:Kelch repeat protein n=1 Tax=Emericellopsis atlantica TaxID=2614577 RepID=A0A9P7ZHS7_9HYPO|nr:uncharacterized protein F5Z01DRAFT_662528 [Emericellopsis atlantica]KAG9251976.1 hypothetical protein F5Z01DRAFT_662528 [Emericellopsis atlantica]